jgi:two-component system, NtrC family, response regulator HydG
MAKVLIIDDNETIRDGLAHAAKKLGHTSSVHGNGTAGIEAMRMHGADFVITDLKMDGISGVDVVRAIAAIDPDVPVMVLTGYGTVDSAVEAMKLGAFDFVTKPVDASVVRLKIERALELCATRRSQRRSEGLADCLQRDAAQRFSELVGGSEPMLAIRKAIDKVAASDTTVFIGGESGTGKELVARAIHQASKRCDGPFIKVNCSALTESLLETELFGHEKGAFTGAIRQKLGRFELADGGTIFLDEVGDVPAAMQAKLLRALQERTFERVGGESTIKVDVRVLSATNKDLEAEVAAGRFRADLYFRLHVIPLTLPALRDRRDDIPMLVQHFITKLAAKTNSSVRTIADDALGCVLAYAWPGNVRELENAVEQALVFADGSTIDVVALPKFLQPSTGGDGLRVDRGLALPEILEDLEKQLILKAYEQSAKVKTETARVLGIKTSALYYKLEKYGIE